MESVASIVRSEKKNRKDRITAYEREEAKEKKRQDSEQFSGEVAYLIQKFEFGVFDLKSTNKKVADFILDHKGQFYITHAGGLRQEMNNYVYVKPFMSAIKFYKDESNGRQHITKSSKFVKWKKALEDKFKIEIRIGRKYSYKDRYDNDGYATYPDEIFQGVVVNILLQE